jgi:hypothetical protein
MVVARKKRPPIYVETKAGPFRDDPKLGRLVQFRCKGDRLATAEFANRRYPGEIAVLHRSTHRRGQWQLSYFDKYGAVGDSRSKSCDALVRHRLEPRGWRIRKIRLSTKAPK